MDNLDMFQAIFEKVDNFGWWYMERIQNNAGMQFTYKEFQEGIYVCGVPLLVVVTYHQEKNFQVGVTQ